MTIKTITPGTAHAAPVINDYIVGKPSWSGKKDTDFDDSLIKDLRCYIQDEASQIGYNDAICDKDMIPNSIFHSDFLDGWPNQLWIVTYEEEFNKVKFTREVE